MTCNKEKSYKKAMLLLLIFLCFNLYGESIEVRLDKEIVVNNNDTSYILKVIYKNHTDQKLYLPKLIISTDLMNSLDSYWNSDFMEVGFSSGRYESLGNNIVTLVEDGEMEHAFTNTTSYLGHFGREKECISAHSYKCSIYDTVEPTLEDILIKYNHRFCFLDPHQVIVDTFDISFMRGKGNHLEVQGYMPNYEDNKINGYLEEDFESRKIKLPSFVNDYKFYNGNEYVSEDGYRTGDITNSVNFYF